MLMARRTSPLASGSVLPSSRVISAAMDSKFLSRMSAALYKMLPRAGPLVELQPGNAAEAAAAAASISAGVAFEQLRTAPPPVGGLALSQAGTSSAASYVGSVSDD